jgi:class 3 adenylate cyclase
MLATHDLEGPAREVFVGSLLLTDISGFTRLTARLCEQDRSVGVERVSSFLNGFMTDLVSYIEADGGTVFGFGGDSLMAGWVSYAQDGLDLAIWQSCYCAERIRAEVRGPVVDDRSLSLRFAVGAGEISLLHVTPSKHQRRLVVSGESLAQVIQCGQFADASEILVSHKAWQLVKNRSRGQVGRDGVVRLEQIEPCTNVKKFTVRSSTEGSDYLVRYLPSSVRDRLRSPLTPWLAELRTVTAMFIHARRPDQIAELEGVDDFVKSVTSVVTLSGGEILDFTIQTSGMECFAVFGLPGELHLDNAKRAISAALRLSQTMPDRPSIGVATGDTFCGILGAAHRANYTVIGEAVNTASRLASVAAGRILTDLGTADAARAQINFDGPWPLHVPGIRGAVLGFEPTSAIEPVHIGEQTPLVGRGAELKRIRLLLERKKGAVVLLAGEAGVGKTALIRALLGRAGSGVRILVSGADEIERGTPYFAWRGIIRSLVGLGDSRGEEAHTIIREFFDGKPKLLTQTPLLNDVLDLRLPETLETLAMSGDGRAHNLRELLRCLVADFVEHHATLLVLEDIHWLDEASGLLLGSLLSGRPPLNLLVSTRSRASEGDLRRWASPAELEIRTERLYPLDFENCAKLARLLLGEYRIAQSDDFIFAQSGGNPFLICEISRIINKKKTEHGEAFGSDAAGDANTLGDPALFDSSRSIVLARTDSLPTDCQAVLKLASAVGTSFRSSDLRALAPIRDASVDIDECIEYLRSVDLIRTEPGSPGRFVFAHAIIRSTVYDSMLAQQRREAHAAVATALEEAGQLDNAETLPSILNHWERAENLTKSLEYLDRVAELRSRQFDNAAVIDLTSRFLKLANDGIAEIDQERRMAACFMLAEANINVGRIESAKEGYKAGLRLAGMPVPETQASLIFHLVLELIEQTWRRLSHWDQDWILKRQEAPPASDRSMLTSKAHEDLTRIYYFTSEKLRLVHAILRATNLAERNPFITPTTASNYSSLGAICGVIPLRRQAKHYSRLGAALMERMDHRGTKVRVHLLSGLYETSVGNWLEARQHFTAGTADSLALGDMRRWCEQAVGLETISGPWLLTPAFAGIEEWRALVGQICREGRTRGDIQVLGCGLLGGIRGHAALGQWSEADRLLEEFSQVLDQQTSGLELIHCIEGASFLARSAFARGDTKEGNDRLAKAIDWTTTLNPAMKTRTLPALVQLFEVVLAYDTSDASRLGIALSKLRRFARVIKVGTPAAYRCEALYRAKLGQHRRAKHCAARAFASGIGLSLPSEAIGVMRRFPDQQANRRALEHLLAESGARWIEVLGDSPFANLPMASR